MNLSPKLKAAIKEGVVAPWLGEADDNYVSEVVTASYCMRSDLRARNLTGKTIVAIITNFKHGTGANSNLFNNSLFNKVL